MEIFWIEELIRIINGGIKISGWCFRSEVGIEETRRGEGFVVVRRYVEERGFYVVGNRGSERRLRCDVWVIIVL